MTTDRYAARSVVNPRKKRQRIPTAVFDLKEHRALDIHITRIRAVKIVKAMNKVLREDE